MTTQTITRTDILETIISKSNDGFNKGQIYGYLQYKYSLSAKDANSCIYEALGKGSTNAPNRNKHVECIREFYGKIDKSDLLMKMDAIGGAHSSNNHKYAYIKDMIEYANQEVEAYKKSMSDDVINNLDAY